MLTNYWLEKNDDVKFLKKMIKDLDAENKELKAIIDSQIAEYKDYIGGQVSEYIKWLEWIDVQEMTPEEIVTVALRK